MDITQINAGIQQLADSLHAEISVSFYDLSTGQTFEYDADKLMHAASTMKVPVMIELYRQAEAGAFSLTDSIEVRNSFRSIVDGSPFSLDIGRDSGEELYSKLGKRTDMRDLITKMITKSSNLATNILIELLDAKKITQTMRELGATEIQVLRGVEDMKAFQKGWSNRTTARDMRVIMQSIAEQTAASASSCDEMVSILKQQVHRDKIPAALPQDFEVASKDGAITAIEHDCAIIYPPNTSPYILVVLTRGIAIPETARRAIADVSKQIFDALQPEGTGKN